MASETIRNIRTVKSFANEALEAQKYKAKLEELQKISKKDRMVEPILNNFEKVNLQFIYKTISLICFTLSWVSNQKLI